MTLHLVIPAWLVTLAICYFAGLFLFVAWQYVEKLVAWLLVPLAYFLGFVEDLKHEIANASLRTVLFAWLFWPVYAAFLLVTQLIVACRSIHYYLRHKQAQS